MKFISYFSLGALAVFMLGALLENSGYDSARNTTPIPAQGPIGPASP